MTIGQYIKDHQPIIYAKLMAMCGVEISYREIAKMMMHSSYKRIGRRIRQVKYVP